MPDLATGLVYYVVFLFSVTVHEAAHAWAAMRGGDLTAYHGGQVSLNPLPHIRREPIGMVVLPLIGVLLSGWPLGFASAPFDPSWARRFPRRAAWMALAGPGANFVLVLLAFLAIRIGAAAGVFYAPESVSFDHLAGTDGAGLWPAVAFMVSVIFSLNLLLAVLNLIPLPPLDGSAAIPLFLSPGATVKYQDFLWANRGLGLFGIFIAWKLFDQLFDPVFVLAINLLFPGVTYS